MRDLPWQVNNMSVELVMPKAGLTMIEGVISTWRVEEGAHVKMGEAVMEFENEKTTMECESNADGFVHIVAAEGSVVKVGAPVAIIAATKEEYDALGASDVVPEVAVAPPSASTAQVVVSTGCHVRATGLARNIAKEAGTDLAKVSGTGPNGRIVASDVYAYLETAKSSVPVIKTNTVQTLGDPVRTPLSAKRKAIAKNMRKTFETMAPLTAFAEIDVTELVDLRKKYVAQQDELGVKISLNDIMMLASVKMLQKHPELNATFDGEAITTYPYINLGMAVGAEEGLVVPTLKNAEQYGLAELSKALKDMAIRAKEGELVNGEQSGGTFTVTNVGMFNIDFGTPVIFPPQVAIISFGSAKRKLVEYNDEFVPRTMMHVALSFDHQVVDGRLAGEVLGTMKKLLEHPELIFA